MEKKKQMMKDENEGAEDGEEEEEKEKEKGKEKEKKRKSFSHSAGVAMRCGGMLRELMRLGRIRI